MPRMEKKYHECSHSNFFDMIRIINAISNTQFAVKVHIPFSLFHVYKNARFGSDV